MFDLAGDNVIAFIPIGFSDTFKGLIVGFGAAAGKDNLFRPAIEQGSNLAAGLHDGLVGGYAVPV